MFCSYRHWPESFSSIQHLIHINIWNMNIFLCLSLSIVVKSIILCFKYTVYNEWDSGTLCMWTHIELYQLIDVGSGHILESICFCCSSNNLCSYAFNTETQKHVTKRSLLLLFGQEYIWRLQYDQALTPVYER